MAKKELIRGVEVLNDCVVVIDAELHKTMESMCLIFKQLAIEYGNQNILMISTQLMKDGKFKHVIIFDIFNEEENEPDS